MSKEYYCPNPECDNMAFEPGVCSGCGSTLEEYEQFIPAGHYLVEDADGKRLVRKPTTPIGERVAELLASFPPGRNCPKCGGMMIHERLRGYRCFRGCD